MSKGSVKWFNNDRGYGFILGEDGSEAFVHFSDVQVEGFKALNKGQSVEYEIEKGAKGHLAKNVVPHLE